VSFFLKHAVHSILFHYNIILERILSSGHLNLVSKTKPVFYALTKLIVYVDLNVFMLTLECNFYH